MNVDGYFSLIWNLINRTYSWAISEDKTSFEKQSDSNGYVHSRIYFTDGSFLDFREYIRIESNRVVEKYLYTYQYVKDSEQIFRYDNWAHYPGLPNFPHHKHIKGKVIPAKRPDVESLKDVIEEIIRDYLRL